MAKAFHTIRKPSQSIFSNVLTGPIVTLTEVDGLETFARYCDETLCFMESSTGTFLSFNEQMTKNEYFKAYSPNWVEMGLNLE